MDSQDGDFFTQEGPGLFADAPASVPSVPQAPLALYRRYRPEVFSEVIGQDHVTEPLRRALTNNRVNHAYLFSGPRGCGKTSSARILARSLNCEKGPTPDPCGECASCRDLARGGPGSIDVLEIDAASHGGVDDARDLRERAFFAPVRSRYRIYIVDEAHMVSTQGFNALLKLVEEPPPHVKFIFATTEPDKVIGTIRSRTHHYPFRLIPPKTMVSFLTKICEEEGIAIDPKVIPLVVRAGGGSVRDALSVLDQLFGGAGETGVGYAQATALLGYTPDSLLNSVVDGFADQDPGAVFASVDKVIEAGQDPRRFTEDLLRRLRDLVIVAAVPDALSSGLLEIPEDQGDVYSKQAKAMGVAGLTRAAVTLAAGLNDMRGTTAPRLQLELMCARILLPSTESGDSGLAARVELLEKQISGMSAAPVRPVAQPVRPSPEPVRNPPAQPHSSSLPAAVAAEVAPIPAPEPVRVAPTLSELARASIAASQKADEPVVAAPAAAVPSDGAPRSSDMTTDFVRSSWPRILNRVSGIRRYVWMILNQYAEVTELRNDVLWLTFKDAGARDNFNKASGEDYVAQAVHAELSMKVLVRARLESEPIPNDGTAILSLAKPVPHGAVPVPQHESRPSPTLSSVASSASSAAGLEDTEPLLAGTSDEKSMLASPVVDEAPAPAPEPEPAQAEDPVLDIVEAADLGPIVAEVAEEKSAPPVPSRGRKRASTPPKDPEPDAPSEDDEVVENPADQAEELVMELFDAELVGEETTKPSRRKKS